MARRRYRRKSPMAGGMLADTAYIANRLPWESAAFLGVVLFAIFYWVLPAWLTQQLEQNQGNMYRPIIEAVFAKRIHWVQWLGTALGLICAFFAFRNYFAAGRMGWEGERNASFLSRWLARFFD